MVEREWQFSEEDHSFLTDDISFTHFFMMFFTKMSTEKVNKPAELPHECL
ncbi:hypothetical protein DDI_0742 [Dickeya dianthicola RNS04.9]|nr:hypothetical protein DDI_0742 [Dickeya dianthicola RNS04.9]